MPRDGGQGSPRGALVDLRASRPSPKPDIHSTRRALRHGPYKVGRALGTGGMARVNLGRPLALGDEGTLFALKRILPDLAGSSRFIRMFCREAVLGSLLAHPNIVRVFDFGEQDGELMLVTEFVEGTSCEKMLRAVAERGQSFPAPVALFVAAETLNALAYAHDLRDAEGYPLEVVHRDVSPANILLGAMGEVKLTDFGVALSNDGLRDTSPGMLKGKLGYMSPEQAGSGAVDRRSDLFSVGVVLFEMLTGRRVVTRADDDDLLARVKAGHLSEVARARALPLSLRLILATALARDPVERFGNAREFREALVSFARHAGIPLSRNALVDWLRYMGVWPFRSGTYQRVKMALPLEPGSAWSQSSAREVPPGDT